MRKPVYPCTKGHQPRPKTMSLGEARIRGYCDCSQNRVRVKIRNLNKSTGLGEYHEDGKCDVNMMGGDMKMKSKWKSWSDVPKKVRGVVISHFRQEMEDFDTLSDITSVNEDEEKWLKEMADVKQAFRLALDLLKK